MAANERARAAYDEQPSAWADVESTVEHLYKQALSRIASTHSVARRDVIELLVEMASGDLPGAGGTYGEVGEPGSGDVLHLLSPPGDHLGDVRD